MTLLWAKQPSMPRGSKRRACQTRPQGWNRYGVWQSVFVKGVNVISYKVRSKRKAAETAATVRRHAAFRKTQTPSANSLTRRHSERKKNSMSEFHKGDSVCRFSVNDFIK